MGLGSGIRENPIPDPGIKKRHWIPDPQHWLTFNLNLSKTATGSASAVITNTKTDDHAHVRIWVPVS
jgi:hypothetical protein